MINHSRSTQTRSVFFSLDEFDKIKKLDESFQNLVLFDTFILPSCQRITTEKKKTTILYSRHSNFPSHNNNPSYPIFQLNLRGKAPKIDIKQLRPFAAFFPRWFREKCVDWNNYQMI
mmetsp:Transcript_8196/g.12094  ORF Transcript_8196/g.12094 Transcript_8196/m.12094 type:complete len:117 (-) Transcript_8196:71-421(-)